MSLSERILARMRAKPINQRPKPPVVQLRRNPDPASTSESRFTITRMSCKSGGSFGHRG